jgi:hypothetical protein
MTNFALSFSFLSQDLQYNDPLKSLNSQQERPRLFPHVLHV